MFDAFVARLNPAGAVTFATFLGGNFIDAGKKIAVDGVGDVYVAGYTSSVNFPTTNPFQASLRGPDDSFVAKLKGDASGYVYRTFLGGAAAEEQPNNLAVDEAGQAVVVGATNSADLPTTSDALQPASRGSRDLYVTKLHPLGTSLLYSSYLGGNGLDGSQTLPPGVVATGNRVIVSGVTTSGDFPVRRGQATTSGVRSAPAGLQGAPAGAEDAVVTDLDVKPKPLCADLGITMALGPALPPQTGGTLIVPLRASVANGGQLVAESVVVQFFLSGDSGRGPGTAFPATCDGGTLYCQFPVLGSAEIGFDLSFPADFPSRDLTVFGTTMSATCDANPRNNAASATLNSTADITLVVEKPGAARLGQTVTFPVTVVNNGPDTANASIRGRGAHSQTWRAFV